MPYGVPKDLASHLKKFMAHQLRKTDLCAQKMLVILTLRDELANSLSDVTQRSHVREFLRDNNDDDVFSSKINSNFLF